jgi:hypothetical protein
MIINRDGGHEHADRELDVRHHDALQQAHVDGQVAVRARFAGERSRDGVCVGCGVFDAHARAQATHHVRK